MKVAIYCRVSTTDQSTDLQRLELTAYAAGRNWEVYQIYEENITGTHTNRPQLQAMLQAAQSHKFDAILVWKLDRFARSLKDLVTMLEHLSETNIAFISLRDHVDLSTSAGRLMLHMIGAFAEFEASIIKERVKSGIAAHRKKHNNTWGRRPTVDIDKVNTLRAQGHSLRNIAKLLNTSLASVQRAINRASIQSHVA